MKSAYELAMERLHQQQGEVRSLSAEQKQQIAEITRDFKAKVAEKELELKPRIEAALAGGDWSEADNLREELGRAIERLATEEESRKQAIREQGTGRDTKADSGSPVGNPPTGDPTCDESC